MGGGLLQRRRKMRRTYAGRPQTAETEPSRVLISSRPDGSHQPSKTGRSYFTPHALSRCLFPSGEPAVQQGNLGAERRAMSTRYLRQGSVMQMIMFDPRLTKKLRRECYLLSNGNMGVLI